MVIELRLGRHFGIAGLCRPPQNRGIPSAFRSVVPSVAWLPYEFRWLGMGRRDTRHETHEVSPLSKLVSWKPLHPNVVLSQSMVVNWLSWLISQSRQPCTCCFCACQPWSVPTSMMVSAPVTGSHHRAAEIAIKTGALEAV